MNAIDKWDAGHQSQMIDVRLVAIRYAAQDIHLFELEAVDGGVLPEAEPGAHIELYLPGNLIRHYSLIVPDPKPARYVIGVKRDAKGRGGSIYVHDQLRVGATFKISRPRNNFKLVDGASRVVLIAGGIGITPLMSMARRLDEEKREWNLFYAARSRADMAFCQELMGKPNVHLHFDDENSGVPLNIAAVIGDLPKDAHFYCCGPGPMMSAFESAAQSLLPVDQIHLEYFSSVQEAATGGGFTVELARRKQEFVVQEGHSILNTLLEAGVNVAYSCEEGICGACEVRVLSGTPDHRDSVLTPQQRREGKRMMICCSGSKTDRIVIDI